MVPQNRNYLGFKLVSFNPKHRARNHWSGDVYLSFILPLHSSHLFLLPHHPSTPFENIFPSFSNINSLYFLVIIYWLSTSISLGVTISIFNITNFEKSYSEYSSHSFWLCCFHNVLNDPFSGLTQECKKLLKKSSQSKLLFKI